MESLSTRNINREKLVTRNTPVVEKQEIAENLNKYFRNIGSSLASKIPNKQGGFEKHLTNCKTVMNDALLIDEEFLPSRLIKVQATKISLSM